MANLLCLLEILIVLVKGERQRIMVRIIYVWHTCHRFGGGFVFQHVNKKTYRFIPVAGIHG